MGRPSAPTAGDPTVRGPTPALPRGRPAGLPGARSHRPPPRRERKAPEDEVPASQEGMEGETEVEMEEERGPVQTAMETGEYAGGRSCLFFCLVCRFFLFPLSGESGGKGIG